MHSSTAVRETQIKGLAQPHRGKVRDVYDLGEILLLVACDRISAYDHVLSPAIPGKGKILNQLSNFWFATLRDRTPNHVLATDVVDFPAELSAHHDLLKGRSVLVRKAEVVPFECVARGYLAGSGYREYLASGEVCGVRLPDGMKKAGRLPEPIFTPATKAESGHDENVSFEVMATALGSELATILRDKTLEIFQAGTAVLERQGLLLADTKFEFGMIDDEILLIDEVLTPDSSRFWEADAWTPGTEPVSFDKQYVRNWLDESGWDHESAPPRLSDGVVQGTLDRYIEAFRRVTGTDPEL
jgi:phosphoribosylaminoimidazole-succinocarboxamide synthase